MFYQNETKTSNIVIYYCQTDMFEDNNRTVNIRLPHPSTSSAESMCFTEGLF